MLKKENRFHKRNAVRYLLRRGKQERSGPITVRYQESNQANTRVAVVVSKKVSKKAVTRNRIRRRIFAIMREKLPEITEPHDLAIIVFSEKVANMDAKELQDLLTGCLKRAGVLQ